MKPTEKDSVIRSGSNLQSFQALIERLQRAVKQERQPVADTFRSLQQKKKPLLNKVPIRELESAIEKERRAFASAALPLMGDTVRIRRLKTQTRNRIHKLLTRSFPNAQQIIALNKSHVHEYKRALKRLGDVFDDSIVTSLEVGLPEVDYDAFKAPFELHGVHSDLVQTKQPSSPNEVDEYIVYNGSFVIPSWGVMANDITFRHNHSSWLKQSDFRQRENIAVLGIHYRMPRTGHVNVSAVVQNLSNDLTLSINDNFGFSKAEIDASHRLYVIIVRPSGALFDLHYQVTVQAKLLSGGDDVSDFVSELQTTVPYAVNFSSPETFNEGDELSILIGTHVHVSSYLEFMNSRIDATFAWLLKAMYVSVT